MIGNRFRVAGSAPFSALALFLIFATARPASAQALTGAITGRVQDSSTALMPGVVVNITSPAMIGGTRGALTDEQGTYRFTLLPAGSYRVTFMLPGFRTLNVDDVGVNVGATTTINGTLEVATQVEEVSVTSSVPTIDLEDSTVGVNWSQQKFDNLPYGRFIRGLVQMVPGLYATAYDVGGNTKGGSTSAGTRTYGRSGGDAIMVDGALFGGGFGEFGSYGEAQVVTAAKGAEAMSPGTAFSFVIKSGGNDFHGSFYDEYEDGKFQSNNVTQKLLNRGFNPSGNKFTHSNDLTAEIGGPIRHDKLWFYYSQGDTYVGQFVPGFVSTQTGQPAVYYIALHSPTLKLTAQLTSKMKLEASMHSTYKYQPYRAGNQFNPLEASEKETYWGGGSFPTLTWTYIVNPKMTMMASFHRSGYYYRSDAWTSDVRRTDLVTTQTRGAFQTIHRYPRRWQWDGAWSWFSPIAGKNNEVKSGYTGIWDNSRTVNVGYPNQEVYRYRSRTGETDYFLHPDSVVVYDYPSELSSGVHYNSWFINDKVTMTRRLTVNAGVRFDRYSSWLPKQGNPGVGPFSTQNVLPERHDFPAYNSWLPRLSLVYDVAGSGKLVLKASYGRYVGNGSTIGSGPTASQVNANEATVRTYTNWDGSIPYIPRSTDLSSVTGGSGTRRLDPNLKAPFMEEITGGIEIGLNRDYLIRFNTVRKVDRHKSKTLDLAQPFSAYTDVRYGVDPGRDNITGTADDGTIQVWSVPRSYPTFGQVNQFITNTNDDEAVDLYTALETSFSKQYSKGWSLLVGYTADFAKRRNVTPQNPNDLFYNWQLPVWSNTLKINGQHNLPWGLMYAATYQIQSGEWYGRFAQTRNALNALVNVQVENHVGRYDWVKLWDNRISKTFKLSERQSIEGMFNVYNTLNSSAVLTQVNTNGPDYLKPLVGASSSGSSAGVESAILPPRIFSLGARWRF